MNVSKTRIKQYLAFSCKDYMDHKHVGMFPEFASSKDPCRICLNRMSKYV
jgi:hypothetical protein